MQFDVFVNPIVAARRAYPYVIALQSDAVNRGRDQIVAPLVPRQALAAVAGRLTPLVIVESLAHVVLMPALSAVRARDLEEFVSSLAAARAHLLAAIDLLFFGV